jgi:hypothetical protein
MAQSVTTPVPVLETIREGVRVEADRHFIRFYGGNFEGRHRWPDYTTFIEPVLEPWERERIYRLWVLALNATHYIPYWASPVMGGQSALV